MALWTDEACIRLVSWPMKGMKGACSMTALLAACQSEVAADRVVAVSALVTRLSTFALLKSPQLVPGKSLLRRGRGGWIGHWQLRTSQAPSPAR